jgi:hypothetical protein
MRRELITELVGEMISDEECEQRMLQHKAAQEVAFYFVELGGCVPAWQIPICMHVCMNVPACGLCAGWYWTRGAWATRRAS